MVQMARHRDRGGSRHRHQPCPGAFRLCGSRRDVPRLWRQRSGLEKRDGDQRGEAEGAAGSRGGARVAGGGPQLDGWPGAPSRRRLGECPYHDGRRDGRYGPRRLANSNIGVLVPRAAVLLAVARNQRDAARMRDLAGQSAANFESALALRRNAFHNLGQHNRGEYLSGLAESWALAGNKESAEGYLRRILAELPNSVYAERAAAKLVNWDERRPLNCQSCH